MDLIVSGTILVIASSLLAWRLDRRARLRALQDRAEARQPSS
jgi:hypothetical protein